MHSKENTYDDVDRYVLNEMTEAEKVEFENKIALDDNLANEVAQQRIMLNIIDEHEEEIKNTNASSVSEPSTNRKKLKTFRTTRKKRILSTLGIAISISIITFISTLYIMNRKAIKINQEKSVALTTLDNRLTVLEDQVITNKEALTANTLSFSNQLPQLHDTLFTLNYYQGKKEFRGVGLVSKINLQEHVAEIQPFHTIDSNKLAYNNQREIIGLLKKTDREEFYQLTRIRSLEELIQLIGY